MSLITRNFKVCISRHNLAFCITFLHSSYLQDPTYNSGKFGEIRELIMGMLDTYSYEEVTISYQLCVNLIALSVLKCSPQKSSEIHPLLVKSQHQRKSIYSMKTGILFARYRDFSAISFDRANRCFCRWHIRTEIYIHLLDLTRSSFEKCNCRRGPAIPLQGPVVRRSDSVIHRIVIFQPL